MAYNGWFGMETRAFRVAAPGVLFVALAFAAAPAHAQDSGIGIALGATAPAATVEDLDGNRVELARYIGTKPVLIEFWATWCPVCDKLAPTVDAAYAKHRDRVEFLTIGVGVSQSPRQIRRHMERHGLPGQVLYDAKGEAVRAFRVPTTSFIVILDATGKVTYTGSGEDQPLDRALARALGAPGGV